MIYNKYTRRVLKINTKLLCLAQLAFFFIYKAYLSDFHELDLQPHFQKKPCLIKFNSCGHFRNRNFFFLEKLNLSVK